MMYTENKVAVYRIMLVLWLWTSYHCLNFMFEKFPEPEDAGFPGIVIVVALLVSDMVSLVTLLYWNPKIKE